MIISFVVAASENNAIGKNNQLLWHLPNDMKFFKNTTWGMPVIMGRKTFESMKNKPLTGRFNIVVTRNNDLQSADGKIWIADSIERSLELAALTDCKEAFVIGGGALYKEFMPRVSRIYLTRVHAQLEGDTFFPELNEKEWELRSFLDFPADEKHAYPYSFQLWQRKGN
ncbi:MAG TPA: dihydrofolate reductase [Chitinophagaceae bacterium]